MTGRLRAGLVAVLMAQTLVGQAVGDTPTPERLAELAASRGDRTLDPVTDAGAIPGQKHEVVTRRAIQACLDAVKPHGDPIRVVIRAGLFCDRPLLVPGGGWLDGRGVGSIRFGRSGGLILGLARAPDGVAVLAADLPRTNRALDKTAQGKIGVHLGGHQTINDLGGAFSSLANWWRDAKAITIDLAYSTAGVPKGHAITAGWSEGPHPNPAYLMIEHDEGKALGLFGDPNVKGGFRFFSAVDPKLANPGTHRVAFQVDVTQAKAILICDGRVTRANLNDWAPARDARLVPHGRTPFKVGGGGVLPQDVRSAFGKALPPGGYVLGCRVEAAARYNWDAPTPRRLDGKLIDDGNSYFQWEGEAASLTLDDEPVDVISTRSLHVTSGRPGTALLVDVKHGTGSSQGGGRVEGLRVQSDGGDAVSIGVALSSKLERCELSGRGCGLGGLRMGANYVHAFRDLSLDGGEYSGFLDLAMFHMTGVALGSIPRSGLRLVYCHGQVEHLFAGATRPGAESFIRVEGGALRLNDAAFDVEGGRLPSLAIIDAVTEGAATMSSGVRVEADWIALGIVPKGASVFRLRTSPVDWVPHGVLRVGSMTTSGDGRNGGPLVDVDNPSRWSIRVDRTGLGPVDRWPIRTTGGQPLGEDGRPEPSSNPPAPPRPGSDSDRR